MTKNVKEDFNLKLVVSDLQRIEALLKEHGEAYIKVNKDTGKVEVHKVSDLNSVKESIQRLEERLDFKQADVLKAAEPLRIAEGMLTKEAVAEIVREEVSGQLSSFYAENEDTFRDIVSDCLVDWTNDIKDAATPCCPKLSAQKQNQGGDNVPENNDQEFYVWTDGTKVPIPRGSKAVRESFEYLDKTLHMPAPISVTSGTLFDMYPLFLI